MTAICVDDEELALSRMMDLCLALPQISGAEGFLYAREALGYLRGHAVDLCLLDIDLPDMNGIELAARIKEICPDAAIVFVTAYSEYAASAFELHANGYLLKPIDQKKLASEIDHIDRLLSDDWRKRVRSRIIVRTFGGFDVFVDGKSVAFHRSRAKELLAYLVDRRGGSVTAANAFAVLFEDEPYDRARQKQFYVIIHSLKKTLSEYGISEMFEMSGGTMRAVPESFDCDMYRFLKGDAEAVNDYRGEYMDQYPWASLTEGYMTDNKYRLKNDQNRGC